MTAPFAVPEITPTELKARMDAGDAPAMVDVREPYEAEIADLPERGQLRIPQAQLQQRLDELDPAREYVVYCRSGNRSAWATAMLRQRGYENVLNLKGGVLGWREEVDPTLEPY